PAPPPVPLHDALPICPPAEYGIDPTSFDDMRPGCFDIKERVRDMNANGVLGSLCFPSMPGFCGQLWARVDDKGVAKALLQGYNRSEEHTSELQSPDHL